jgi:hypothetical protein
MQNDYWNQQREHGKKHRYKPRQPLHFVRIIQMDILVASESAIGLARVRDLNFVAYALTA